MNETAKWYFDAMKLFFEIFLGIGEWNIQKKREEIPPS